MQHAGVSLESFSACVCGQGFADRVDTRVELRPGKVVVGVLTLGQTSGPRLFYGG
jgi:hypothetical protein